MKAGTKTAPFSHSGTLQGNSGSDATEDTQDNAPMAYDEELAERVRELIQTEDGLAEVRAFGGLAFLIDGNMAVSASGQGGLMVRINPVETEALLAEPHVRPFQMRGRRMKGWLRVDIGGLQSERQLESWVARCVAYARSLPPKR